MRTRMQWDTPDAHSTIGFLHAISAAAHHQMERAHNMTDRRQASHPWHSSLAKEKAVQMTAESTKACTAACSSAGVHDAQILFLRE